MHTARMRGGKRDVVEQAEAHAARRRRMMARRTDQAERRLLAACQDSIDGSAAGAGGSAGHVIRGATDHGIGVERADLLLGGESRPLDNAWIVDLFDHICRQRRERSPRTTRRQTRIIETPCDHAQALSTLGMGACLVAQERRVGDE